MVTIMHISIYVYKNKNYDILIKVSMKFICRPPVVNKTAFGTQ